MASARSDVFSYGVLLWEMTHRQIPFGKDSGLQAAFAVAVERRRPLIKLPPLLEQFGGVITRAWAHEATARPNMQSVVVDCMVIDAKIKADCSAALRSQPPPRSASAASQPGGAVLPTVTPVAGPLPGGAPPNSNTPVAAAQPMPAASATPAAALNHR